MSNPVIDNGSGNDYTVSTKTLLNGSEVQQIELVTATDGGSATEFGTAGNPIVATANLGTIGGAATAAKQDTEIASLGSIDGKVPALGQALAVASVPVVLTAAQVSTLTPPAAITGYATSAKQDTGNTSVASIDTKTPALGQALAAVSVPVVLTAVQVSTLTPPAAITGYATETTLGTRLSESDFDTKAGSLTESAPATDTASSGLNGRLQRIAQRLTSLIALLPAALISGRLDVNLGAAPATVTIAAVPAGSNNIGDVDVLTVPADPFGANADAAVAAGAVGSVQAKLRRATQGLEDLKSLIVLAAGANNIGDVDVLTVPSDPFGANADAAATAGSTGTMQAKFRLITSQLDAIKTSVELLDNAVSGSAFATVETVPTTIINGNKNVTTAGTRVTLAASTAAKSVTVKAKSGNTGVIYVGDASVSSANGFQLAAGESVSLDLANLNTVNLDASVNGEGVTFLAVA